MLCITCDQGRLSYTRDEIVDVRRGMVLVKNLVFGFFSLGTNNPCDALKRCSVTAVGRVIEAPTGVGSELIGKKVFYIPNICGERLCSFSEGDPVEAIEIGRPETPDPQILIEIEAQLALRYSRRSGASPLIIGGGFLPHIALYILQISGIRGYTIERSFRGVDSVNLKAKNAIGRRYSSIYIAGLPSDAEKKVLEDLLIDGDLKIYIHPLLRSERIYVPLGDRVYTRVFRYSAPSPRSSDIAVRFMKIAKGYSYAETSVDEELPAMGDLIAITLTKD